MKIAATISWAQASTFYMHLFHLMLPIPYYLHFKNKEIVAQEKYMTYPEQVPEAEPGGKSPDLWDPQVVLFISQAGGLERPQMLGERGANGLPRRKQERTRELKSDGQKHLSHNFALS